MHTIAQHADKAARPYAEGRRLNLDGNGSGADRTREAATALRGRHD